MRPTGRDSGRAPCPLFQAAWAEGPVCGGATSPNGSLEREAQAQRNLIHLDLENGMPCRKVMLEAVVHEDYVEMDTQALDDALDRFEKLISA